MQATSPSNAIIPRIDENGFRRRTPLLTVPIENCNVRSELTL